MPSHSIYALCDPDTGDVRYIGRTSTTLYQRLYVHISSGRPNPSRNGTPKLRDWISELLEGGKKPSIVLLAECPSDRSSETERQFILSYHRDGYNLLNTRGKSGKIAKAPEREILLRMPAEMAARFDLVVKAKFTSRSALMRELVTREIETFFATSTERQP